MTVKITRRTAMAGMAGSLVVGPRAFAQGLTLPKSPVTINIVDVAGNLALTQPAIETYRAAKPKLVSKVTFSKAPAPELPGKIKAQQDAGRVDIDGVLTGIDALSAGVEQKLWTPLLPDYAANLPKLDDIYLPGAAEDAGPCREPGRVHRLLSGGPAARIHARQGQDLPDHGRRAAGLGQGRTRTASSMRARPTPAPAASS